MSETSASAWSSPVRSGGLSVAVMVDGITTTASNGNPTWAPRPQTEMETLGLLVQSAIGFDARAATPSPPNRRNSPVAAEQVACAERAGLCRCRARSRADRRSWPDRASRSSLLWCARCSAVPEPALVALTGPVRHHCLTRRRCQLAGKDVFDLPPQSCSKRSTGSAR